MFKFSEARRMRLGFRSRTYNYNKQPWLLNIQQKEGKSSGEKPVKERRFRSIKQAGATENADYWMFVKVYCFFNSLGKLFRGETGEFLLIVSSIIGPKAQRKMLGNGN